jgi:exonuclease SbcC
MDLKRLTLHNYRSHKHTELEFDKDFYVILGKIEGESKSNGSGKSSIPEALSFANFGNADKGISNDSFIYNDADKMFVEALYDVNGEEIKVKRSVKRGSSPVLKITRDGEEFSPGLKAGQTMINQILGADFNIYRNTSYFKQGDLNSFSSLTPKEAKEVVIKILQLDNYNNYEDLAKDMSKKVVESINKLESEISVKLNGIKVIEEDTKRVKYTQADLDKVNMEIENLNLKNGIKQTAIQKRDEEVKVIEEKISIIDKERNEIGFHINQANSRIKKLQGLSDTCPTCESKLNSEDINKIIDLINKESSSFNSKLGELDYKLDAAYQDRQKVLSIALDETDYVSQINALGPEIGKIEAELGREQLDKTRLDSLKKELRTLEDTRVTKLVLKESYDKLQKAFGKKGIQAHIIDSVIPEIQATTNDILKGLETKIRLSIDSQKKLKSGNIGETLDINVLTEYGERPYSNYSGGEKTLIDFALRIALSVILTRRSECQIQTLVLDEVFGELDAENKKIVSRALRYVANKFNFKKILIISHAEELQESFNNVIRVAFDGVTSYIQKENKNGQIQSEIELAESQ